MPTKNPIDTILRRKISGEQLEAYIGPFSGGYLTHAVNAEVREKAASGGTVTALLIHLLQSGKIDGALVNTLGIEAGRVRARFTIATSVDEILEARGSKYQAVHFASEALPLIRAFKGRLAVVALPCDATLLDRQRKNNPGLDKKIALVISLFCGHNSEPELTERIISRLNRNNEKLLHFRYRSGHWRGSMDLVFKDSARTVPFTFFSNYQNLYFFCQRKCLYCEDHFGYHCDISAGDIWSAGMKSDDIKHTALITRSQNAEGFLQQAVDAGHLEISPCPVEDIFQGQIRTARCHYQVTARSRISSFFGEDIPDSVHAHVRLVDYLIAAVVLLNYRISRSAFGKKIIFAIPKPLLKLYLYFFKGLESI